MSKSIVLSVIVVALVAGAGFWLSRSENESTEPINPNPTSAVAGACYVGGCSSQICSDEPGAVSSCEYREEYACYQGATCERQADGECGWTETPELNICLNAVLETGVDMK